MAEILALDKNGQYTYLDIPSDVSIALNKSIEDIEDITARKGGYTKTFTIPGSARNDIFFQSAFDVNATDFNNTLQSTCIIQYKGTDIIRGTMRLNKVTNLLGQTNYEVYIVETITPFSSQLEQITICDLDFSDIEHSIDYDNIVSTWEYSGGSYMSYSGLTGKVLYPLAQTGYDEDTTYGTFNFSSTGFTNASGTAIQTTQFKPWVSVKYLMDKVFEKAGFTYTSDFMDTQYFNSIFMYAGKSDKMGANVLEETPKSQNFFKVYQDTFYYYPYPQYDNYVYMIFNAEEYDYLDRYTLATFPTNPGQFGATNYFQAPISGAYQFRLDFTSFVQGYYSSPTYIDYVLYDIDTNTVLQIYSAYPVTSSNINHTFYYNATLTANQRVAVKLKYAGGDIYNSIAIKDAVFELYSSPVLSTTGNTMNWSENLPCDVQALDFVKETLTYFNLVCVPTGENSFLIEPYPDYLSSLSGDTVDWSQKLNLNETYTIEPLDFSLQRQLNFTYKTDPTVLGKFYQDNFSLVFGENTYTSFNTLLSGSQKIETMFQSLPTNTVNGASNCDFVVPHLYESTRDGQNNVIEKPYSSDPRLGFYCGMKIPYSGSSTLSWYFQSGATVVNHTKYPVVNHMSILTYTGTSISDLNFKSMWDFFQTHSDLIGYTQHSVYNDFYQKYIDLLYSPEARLFTGMFYLTPEDIKNIDFNDTIYFLNAQWRLLEIVDGDITEPNMIQCKLLKVPYRVPNSTPIPPDYVKQQETKPTPTPTPTAPVVYTWSKPWSFNVDCPLCDLSGPNLTFYTSTTPLADGVYAYSDSGLNVPLAAGRYIKDTSSGYIYETGAQLTIFCGIGGGC